MKLISNEIRRQIRVEQINKKAERTKELTIKNWSVIQIQSEPLGYIKFGGKDGL